MTRSADQVLLVRSAQILMHPTHVVEADSEALVEQSQDHRQVVVVLWALATVLIQVVVLLHQVQLE